MKQTLIRGFIGGALGVPVFWVLIHVFPTKGLSAHWWWYLIIASVIGFLVTLLLFRIITQARQRWADDEVVRRSRIEARASWPSSSHFQDSLAAEADDDIERASLAMLRALYAQAEEKVLLDDYYRSIDRG